MVKSRKAVTPRACSAAEGPQRRFRQVRRTELLSPWPFIASVDRFLAVCASVAGIRPGKTGTAARGEPSLTEPAVCVVHHIRAAPGFSMSRVAAINRGRRSWWRRYDLEAIWTTPRYAQQCLADITQDLLRCGTVRRFQAIPSMPRSVKSRGSTGALRPGRLATATPTAGPRIIVLRYRLRVMPNGARRI